MITKEFREWVEDIKILFEKRIGKYVSIWIEDIKPDTISLGITFSDGQTFWMCFDQIEFNSNNKRQRRSLAKVRRTDLAWHIKTFAKTLIKTANALDK